MAKKPVSDGYSLKIGSSPAGSPYPMGNVLGMVRAKANSVNPSIGGRLRRPGEPKPPSLKAPAPSRPKISDDAPWSNHEPRIGRLNDPPKKMKSKKNIA